MKKNLLYYVIGVAIGIVVILGGYILFYGKAPERQEKKDISPVQPSVRESRKDVPESKEPSSAAPAQSVSSGKRRVFRISPGESWEEIQQKELQKEEDERDERNYQKVLAWDRLVDDVVREDNTQSIEERAKRIQKAFAELPEEDRDVGMQSLLNLLPDESFGVLAPMLMDEKGDPEIVDAIFSDLLNRPEKLKNPYILEIAKWREHPSFVDARHICEVTGLLESEGEEAAKNSEEAINE